MLTSNLLPTPTGGPNAYPRYIKTEGHCFVTMAEELIAFCVEQQGKTRRELMDAIG